MNTKTAPTVSRLEKTERHGDWHDKPVRWICSWESKCQKFSTKRDASAYARIWARNGYTEELKSINEFIAIR